MRITKWVDFGADVEIEIGIEDIAGALIECFSEAIRDPLGEPQDGRAVLRAFGQIGSFLSAVTDEQIALMKPSPRKIIAEFLAKHAERFKVTA